jgi:hypothetical protein
MRWLVFGSFWVTGILDKSAFWFMLVGKFLWVVGYIHPRVSAVTTESVIGIGRNLRLRASANHHTLLVGRGSIY